MNFLKKILTYESLFFWCVAGLVLFVRIRHISIPLERDEGEYAYAAQEILRGYIPYLHFYNMKLPGTYYGYVFMFLFGGDNVITIRIGLIIINALSALMIFLITQKIYKRKAAWLSASVYLIYSLSINALGFTFNAEHFVILSSLIGIYCALQGYYNSSKIKYFYYFLSGFCLAVAYLCKQHAFGYILFLPVWLLKKDRAYSSLKIFTKQFLLPMLTYSMGAASILGMFVYYFYQKNAINELYFYTNKYALSYISQEIPFKGIWRFRPIFWDAPIFWFMQFGSLYFIFYRPNLFKDRFFLFLIWFCSFLCIHPGWYYRPHYFQLLFPGAAIMTGVGLTVINDYWNKKYQFFNPSVFRWLAVVICIISQFKYFFIWNNTDTLFYSYDYNSFDMMKEIGDELKIITKSDDKIGTLCPEPELMFYSQRRSASGFLYHYPLTEVQPYAEDMTKQFIEEIEENKPEIFVFYCGIEDFGGQNKKTVYKLMAWYQSFIQKYELVGQYRTDMKTFRELRWKHKGYDMSEYDDALFYIYKRGKTEIIH